MKHVRLFGPGLLLVLVVAGCSSAHRSVVAPTTSAAPSTSVAPPTSQSTSPASAGGSSTTNAPVVVSVVACPTTSASAGSPGPAGPTTITADLPASTASQLSYYSDMTRSLAPILAPRGWSCQVQIGGNATTGVTVFPTGEAAPYAQAVTATSDANTQSSVYITVCPFVPQAAQQLGYETLACPTAPAGRQVTWIKGSASNTTPPIDDVIGFEDPAGALNPSSATNPTNGVVLYHWASLGNGRASQETCTVPAQQHPLCTAILNDFAARDWLLQ